MACFFHVCRLKVQAGLTGHKLNIILHIQRTAVPAITDAYETTHVINHHMLNRIMCELILADTLLENDLTVRQMKGLSCLT